MKLDIKHAFIYPYQGQNIVDATLIPGAVIFGIFLVAFVVSVLALVPTGILTTILAGEYLNPDVLGPSLTLFVGVIFIMFLAAMIILMVMILGYRWELLAQIYEHGYYVKAPPWQSLWRQIFLSGCAVAGFYLIVGIIFGAIWLAISFVLILISSTLDASNPAAMVMMMPLVLLFMIAGILLIPFIWAPMVHSAMQRRLGALFEIKQAFDLATRYYGQLLLVWLLSFFLFVFYMVVQSILQMLIIGVLTQPFITFAMGVTETHLIAQGFELGGKREESAVPA